MTDTLVERKMRNVVIMLQDKVKNAEMLLFSIAPFALAGKGYATLMTLVRNH